MTIVHCLFTMKTGGAQILTVDILTELSRHHRVSLIIVNDDYNRELLRKLPESVSVYYLNRKEGSRNPLPVLQLNLLLNQLKPAIIHCHERRMIQLIKYQSARTVYTIHDVGIPTDTFRHYDARVAISESVAADVRGRSALPVDVVPNGIPFQQFTRRSQYTPDPESPIRLVQISRLMHEKKGQDLLIRALAELVHRYRETNLRLDFIGDGDSKSYLVSLAESLRVTDYIRFCGEQDRRYIARHLATYHVLVQPSRYEGFGLTVVEGIAAGLPVVASDIDGPAEIMRHVPAGRLFTRDGVDSCVAALRDVLNDYRSGQTEAKVAESYALMAKRFSIQSTADGYLSVYRRLTESAPVRSRFFSFLPQHSV